MIKYIETYLKDDYFFTNSNLFIGKHLFKNNGPIGEYLGVITQINGPNRIFYQHPTNREETYISYRTIGIICDSDEDVEKLLGIKKAINEKTKQFQKEISAFQKDQLGKIVENYDYSKHNFNTFIL